MYSESNMLFGTTLLALAFLPGAMAEHGFGGGLFGMFVAWCGLNVFGLGLCTAYRKIREELERYKEN